MPSQLALGVAFPSRAQPASHRGNCNLIECKMRFKAAWSGIRSSLSEADIEAARRVAATPMPIQKQVTGAIRRLLCRVYPPNAGYLRGGSEFQQDREFAGDAFEGAHVAEDSLERLRPDNHGRVALRALRIICHEQSVTLEHTFAPSSLSAMHNIQVCSSLQ